jgi:hypothetical protein
MSVRLLNQIMAEELSVKDKIALFSKKKGTPVTPQNSLVPTTCPAVKKNRSNLKEEKISEDEVVTWKIVESQDEHIKGLNATIAELKSIAEVRINHISHQ